GLSPVFFFFQAEDGIRDFHVTGVQTLLFRSSDVFEPSGDGVVNTALMDGGVAGPGWVVHGVGLFTLDGVLVLSQDLAAPQSPQEIGRASCRERVEAGGGAGGLESAARARS